MPQANKKSVLAAHMKGTKPKVKPDPLMEDTGEEKKVMIAGHFDPRVKKALMMARVNTGKNLQQLMGRAFNLVCAESGVPEAYSE